MEFNVYVEDEVEISKRQKDMEAYSSAERWTLYLEVIYIAVTRRDMRRDENCETADSRSLYTVESLYLESIGERSSKRDREMGGDLK